MSIAHNPVVRGFAPDPTVIRVGDWYYLAVSSFEWFPTIPIYRSKDLANWDILGSVNTAVPESHLRGVPDSAGIWAPALSHDGARFWVTYSIIRTFHGRQLDVETYIATTIHPQVGWGTPSRVSGHGFDPSVFHHNGQHYLLNVQSDSRPNGSRFSGIVLIPLDEEGTSTAGEPTLLMQHPTLIEGPKMTYHDGWFYLLLAQGGTGVEHGVLTARSRDLAGPYELDHQPLLTSRDDRTLRLQKAGHAELIQTEDGRWYLSHLTSRWLDTLQGRQFPWGRETAIQEIIWTDGWPRLPQGGWHPADTFETPVPITSRSDEEHRPWRTLREPVNADWADEDARPGWIRLRGRHGIESQFSVSLLGLPLRHRRSVIETTLEALPRTFTEGAGLALWYNSSSYYLLELTWVEPEGEVQHGQQWRGQGSPAITVVARDRGDARVVAMRRVTRGASLRLAAHIIDGSAQFVVDGEPLGPTLDVGTLSDDYGDRLRFTGSFAAIYAVDVVDASFTADFTGLMIHEG
ncbi:family 43 glycosylhydrolase [Leifsonia sp. NPDC014704]|uniref:family 43 glycosylhydrolase n=1 Tax=Leifsonia sp. NPDC014704 TaxID=3364123 RepID=UPI0036F459F0